MRVIETTSRPGLPFTASTIDAMHRLVRDGIRDVRVANLAKSIVADVPRRDYRSEAAALLSWVQKNLRYTRDPHLVAGIDRVHHPVAGLQAGGGDCDDGSILLASLAGSIGFPYAFRTIGDDPSAPDDFRHVYVMLNIPGRGWAAADPSFEQPLGWEPSRAGVVLLPDGTSVAAAASVRDWES